MKITGLSTQVRNTDRVNVSIDGKYRFSLDILQVTELGVKVGQELDEVRLAALEEEGRFGKLYAQALEYCLTRPRSVREMRDYLYRKTLSTKYKSRRTGEIKERAGYTLDLTERVLSRLIEKGYVDDHKFATWWIDNRNFTKGSSLRKLRSELASKGVSSQITEMALMQSERSDSEELEKVIAKKRRRYPDDQKLMQYLARQGFSYDDIKSAISGD